MEGTTPTPNKEGNKMTRKDYVIIAKALKTQFELSHENNEDDGLCAVINVANDLATALEADNPRFDRERFLEACGVKSDCADCKELVEAN